MKNRSLTGQIVPGISAGLVVGIINVIFSISLAALIFAGANSPYMANGIGFILLGGIPTLLMVSLFSSYKGSMAPPQDAPAAILAVMAAGIMQSMSSSPSQEKYITVVAAIIFTTVATGITYILLGMFRSGSLVRFLPYPVIGGFLAGTGWLLLTGGIGVMSDLPFNLTGLGVLFRSDVLFRWAPGLVLAFIMLLVLNRTSHFLILPGMLAAIFISFYGIVLFTHTPIPVLIEKGWLMAPFSNAHLWQPLHLSDLALIHWSSILGQAGGMASIIMISVFSLLLNASGIELTIRRDLDLNRELRVTGLGNILGGLLGGIVSYHALTDTAISYKIGKGSRLSGWVVAAVYALPLFFGAAVLSYVPKIMLGSLLILFGLSFLYEWIYQSLFSFSRLEYLVILLILIVIATLGYLQGVGVGIVAAVVLFVVNYSRVSVTRHALTGSERQSRVTRNPLQRKSLLEQGDQTFILQLQGFIFFGTANKLLEQVRNRIEQPGNGSNELL